MKKVFIDGSAGTTGLKIYDRLKNRKDISLVILPDELRKDPSARREAVNSSDIVFLCLPDVASKESVSFLDNDNTVIIDTSTAHRTEPGWTYGFAELEGQKEKIRNSKKIANPGCHASGFIALVQPLVKAGLIDKNFGFTCMSITGYSGGGKQMIADYENKDRDASLSSPRQYGLTQSHKHLKEMKAISGIENAPLFMPVVGDFYSGMEVTVPLYMKDIKGTVSDIKDIYKNLYSGKIVHFNGEPDENGFLCSNLYSGFDDMEISVFGNDERIILTARYDNLGKGASGSAIENMNIVLGTDTACGLNLK